MGTTPYDDTECDDAIDVAALHQFGDDDRNFKSTGYAYEIDTRHGDELPELGNGVFHK